MPPKTKHKKKILLIRYDTKNDVRKSDETVCLYSKKKHRKKTRTHTEKYQKEVKTWTKRNKTKI